ncbi:ABC transporter substrate-binding protein [Methylobacterium sp. P31]
MKRRDFIGLCALTAKSLACNRAFAQSPANLHRIAVLLPMPPSDVEFGISARLFIQSLKKFGYNDGENVNLVFRSVGNEPEAIRRNIHNAMLLDPEMVVCRSTAVTRVVYEEIKSVPVVFVQVSDPMGLRIVDSFRRPGGNLTGFTNLEASMGGKWLQILREIAPNINKVAYLGNHDTSPISVELQASMRKRASLVGISLTEIDVRDVDEIRPFFEKIGAETNIGVIVNPGAFTLVNRREITDQARNFRIPSIYPFRYFVDAGGLSSYGPEVHDAFQQAANYVDKILRGAKPAELPIQGPTRLDFVLNLSVAKAIGVEISPTVIAQADEIVD